MCCLSYAMLRPILMFAVAGLLGIERVGSCHLLVPAELLNSCIFDGLSIVVPETSFTVSRDTCNVAVDKDVFHDQPYVYYIHADEEKTYMVIMMDPEDETRPDEFYLHWIVANVPGYVLKQGLGYGAGETIISYLGPDPQAFSGPHNYMFFAYEQQGTIEDVPVPAYRAKFSPADWFHSLGGDEVVRGPVASIGFLSEY